MGNLLKRNARFVFSAVVLAFLILEIIFGYLLWIQTNKSSSLWYGLCQAKNRFIFEPSQVQNIPIIKESFIPKPMFGGDAYLGYSHIPGNYTVTLTNTKISSSYSFNVSVDKEGNRITSFSPALFQDKREIFIFGDSITFGWMNNDETTFPFFLQLFCPNMHVVNYAACGYGNIHAYLQIKRELEARNKFPEIIVIVYGDYFNDRNVAAPSRLRFFSYNDPGWAKIDPSKFLHPRAALRNEKLEVDYVPLFSELGDLSIVRDPSWKYQLQVTKKILEEISKIVQNRSKLVLAFISGSDSDEVVSFAREECGYVISDIRPRTNKNEWDSFDKIDPHPGPRAQNAYARKLYSTILKLISDIQR